MNSLEQFFHILYNYDLAKEENRRKGITTPVKSPKLTMSFDFPDVDPPIVIAPHEILSDAEVEEEERTENFYNDNNSLNSQSNSHSHSHSYFSSPNDSFITDEVISEDIKLMSELTSESDSDSTPTQTSSTRLCYHPKHKLYKKARLTTNSYVKITKNLAPIVGIGCDMIICRGCMKQTHLDAEYTSHRDYIAPKKAKKEHMLNNLKIEMVGFNQRGKRITRSHPYKQK